MANLNFTYDTLLNWFFTAYGMVESSRAPKEVRKEFALGVIVNAWTYCAMRGEPDFCASRDFVDTMLGAGSFDLLVKNRMIVDDGTKPRWTGPQCDPEWLRGAAAGDASAWITYVVRAGNDGHVKIGRSRNLEKRLETLQTGTPVRLLVLHEIAGDHEKALHAACAEHRLQGEWFAPTPEFFAALMAAIEDLTG
jgi:hypothetical protein